jgi:YD repeat-containing protein
LLKISYEDGTSVVFTYTGDLITKTELKDANNNFTGEYQTMSYLNGRFVQKNFFYNNILFSKYDYIYNMDGTRTKTTTNYEVLNFSNAGTSVSKEYFDAGGNIIKDVWGTYLYDSKNNPHKNITGWIIAEGSGTEKINNLIKETSGKIYTYKYEYNDQGYPISRIMTTGTSTYSEQYFY